MANTNFVANTTNYPNTDLINIINRNSILGFLSFNNGVSFPLTNSVTNLNTIYNQVAEGTSTGELYIVTGSQTSYNDNDNPFNIYLMPNCGVTVWVNSGYSGSCQLEAYNNTTQVVILASVGGSNSSVRMYRNTGSFNTSGSTGYVVVD
jgi:hypothetical protein